MTRIEIESAVVAATGESLATVRRLGFGLVARDPGEPEDLRLVVDCPFCRRVVEYPGLAANGSPALAECLVCDVYFDFPAEEVYAAGSGGVATVGAA